MRKALDEMGLSPSTEAGRLPYCIPEERTISTAWCGGHNRYLRVCIAEALDARAALLAELRREVERLDGYDALWEGGDLVSRAAVLDLIRKGEKP